MILLALFSVLIISGCKEKEEEKSEAWYKQHPDETYKDYKKCL
ncbi:EexN family lipoprotein [Candidatus Williamhamiltonella defendens]|nr:EexN family lipoprotein [Candidatus Hamiltonella defensa]